MSKVLRGVVAGAVVCEWKTVAKRLWKPSWPAIIKPPCSLDRQDPRSRFKARCNPWKRAVGWLMAQIFSTRRNLEREWFPRWWRSNCKECASQKIKEKCISEGLPFTFLLGDHREETSGLELTVEKRKLEGFCRCPPAPLPLLFRSRWCFLTGMSWLSANTA